MTDDQPRERPDFVPPAGDAGLDRLGEPPEGAGPPPGEPAPPPPGNPPYPPAPYPAAPYPPPMPGPPPPMAIPPRQAILPPGPYKHPYQPPHPPSREGKGSLLLGIAITIATLALSWWLSTSVPYNNPLSDVTSGAIVVAPVALIVVGIILSAIQRTTRTGAGILLGLGGVILVLGGLCVALLAQYPG